MESCRITAALVLHAWIKYRRWHAILMWCFLLIKKLIPLFLQWTIVRTAVPRSPPITHCAPIRQRNTGRRYSVPSATTPTGYGNGKEEEYGRDTVARATRSIGYGNGKVEGTVAVRYASVTTPIEYCKGEWKDTVTTWLRYFSCHRKCVVTSSRITCRDWDVR